MMNNKLAELQSKVGKEHRDISKFVQHVFDELDKRAEEHRRLVSFNALAGIKQDGKEEIYFKEHILESKKLLIEILERTTQDFEHQGDKYWEKNFKDGVNE
jgi:hypothetical protein